MARPFYDGYVTWYCRKTGGTRILCSEYDSGTRFSFRARVRYDVDY